MNRFLAAVLWILGALALVWVLLVGGAMAGMGGMMGGGSMMNGRQMMGMGMMAAMALTWVIIIGLIGVLVYLIVAAVRLKRRMPASDVDLDGERS